MEGARFYQILAVLAVVLSVSSATELKLTADKTDVFPGDSVSMRCEVIDLARGSVITWYKVSDEETVRLAQNENFGEDYKNEERLTISLDAGEGKNNYIITLNISNVRLEDAGLFEVKEGFEENGPSAKLNLIVRVDPEPPVLMFDGAEIQGSEVFDMEQDSLHDISCEVKGASPAARLVLVAGDTIVSNDPEVYEYVETRHSEEGETLGFYEVKYDTSLKAEQVPFDARYANKKISCQIKELGLSSNSFRTKFPGMSPLWNDDCPPSAMSFNGEKDISLECDVTASPEADITVVWHYRNPKAKGEIQIRADTPVEEAPQHYSMTVENHNEETKNVTLMISSVKPQMFRDYIFVAKNALGTSNYTVTLDRDPSREVSTGGGATVLSSIVLLIISALCVIFH